MEGRCTVRLLKVLKGFEGLGVQGFRAYDSSHMGYSPKHGFFGL